MFLKTDDAIDLAAAIAGQPERPVAHRPSLETLLDRNAKWFGQGCAAGETDSQLAVFVQTHALLSIAQSLERMNRPKWYVRLWRFLIWQEDQKCT
jgi:hypothetical protein